MLAENELSARAAAIAREAVRQFPGSGVICYTASDGPRPVWTAKGHAGEITAPRTSIPRDRETLGLALKSASPQVFPASDLPRECYSHLDLRRTVACLAYVPLRLDELCVGMLEIVSYARQIDANELTRLDYLDDFGTIAIATAQAYDNERNAQYHTINRLTQLYDLERTLNSTLQMEQLLPIVTAKIRDMLECDAVNLWMVADDGLMLMSRSGSDPTVADEAALAAGEGIAGAVSESGKPVLIASATDSRIVQRNESAGSNALRTLMAVPVVAQKFQVGVLEAINKSNGTAFDNDDLFFLATIALTAGSALHNASLLEAERKVELLETLVQVSQEITSTLNLERVLQVIVNGAKKVIPYDRASVALVRLGKLQLKAVSGVVEINTADPSIRALQEMMEWAASCEPELHVGQYGHEITAEREESRLRFREYFGKSGYRGWYSVSLDDEQGRLGMLCFESRDSDFLSIAHLEFIKVVAGQATVAIRNASLYKEVPLIGVLEPLLERKHRFMRMTTSRRRLALAAAAAAAAALFVVPLPMRVIGDAVVAPLHTAHLRAGIDGVIASVHVREGDHVKAGDVLAEMDDLDLRAALASTQSRYRTALAEANRSLAMNNGTEGGIQRIQAEYWRSEIDRAQERLERARFRSPIGGVVVGPDIENMVGQHLLEGDPLADIVDTSHARINVEMDESDLPIVLTGRPVAVKLESFPTKTFSGIVALISPSSVVAGDKHVFEARVDVPNSEGIIRAGMAGRAKVSVGWRPAGYVLFRGIFIWGWEKIWSLFGG